MKTNDEQSYQDWRATNQGDPYGACIFAYAEAWADAMEVELANGATIADCALRLSREVDRRTEFGVTGFMYGAAVSILAKCWTHGEELRRWHNLRTQFGNEGERANESGGTLNPALLNIGPRTP